MGESLLIYVYGKTCDVLFERIKPSFSHVEIGQNFSHLNGDAMVSIL